MYNLPALRYGALMGLLVTAPLMALLYLAEQVFDLPFVPFDFFDWLARVLPGDIITRVIDTMVEFIDRFDLGETSGTAKTLEALGALGMFLGIGIGAALVLYVVLRHFENRWQSVRLGRIPAPVLVGLLAGAVIGLPLILISQDVNVLAGAPDSVQVIWLAAVFLTWGGALGWAYDHLAVPVPVEAPAGEPVSTPGVTAEKIDRRTFLIRVGGGAATLTVLGAGIGRYLEYRDEKDYRDRIARNRDAVVPQDLPNEGAGVVAVPGTRPEYTPLEDHYRIDINVRPLELDGDSWRLRINGLVDQPLTLSLDDLRRNYDALDQYVTLACISNRIGGDLTSTTRWTGASLQTVLAGAGVQASASHLKITSADGFSETVALDMVNQDPRIMLAYNWDGIPLLHKHGFPLRIYIPDRYGMKQPKWITDIEVMDHDEDGYWVERNWDKIARMRAVSVVDVVDGGGTIERDGQMVVPIGGIAHAGARGISRVEVSVDDGEWTAAALREPLSDTTWVIWRYEWPFEAGEHTFAVRCTEKDGTPQITNSNPTKPSGATGIHRLSRTL
ncbi:MAG: molybdopterin-dependent oxidoreductase [Anaerolineae bacterium]|nr:molybdopterin-dependent oxidoreductase [Anaerolineae bacterium]